MDQVSTELSARFAKSCTTAAFGYARAASAAYAAVANQTFDFWAEAAKSATRPVARDTGPVTFVAGPRPYRSAYAPAQQTDPMDFMGLSRAWASSPMFAPARAWWGLFPFQGNPASWPMAYSMMAAGVPRAVALPAAEANVAAMEAAETATASFERVFSSYRSESGFAVTQVLGSTKTMMTALFAPMTSMFAFRPPWA